MKKFLLTLILLSGTIVYADLTDPMNPLSPMNPTNPLNPASPYNWYCNPISPYYQYKNTDSKPVRKSAACTPRAELGILDGMDFKACLSNEGGNACYTKFNVCRRSK